MLRTTLKRTRAIRHNLISLRYLSKNETPSSPSNENTSSPDEVQSAIVDRMKQILEEKISTQSASSLNTMKQADDSLKNILSKYDTPGSTSTHLPNAKQASSYIKSEPLLAHNKHAKDIYNSQPWTGQESNYDANLRMVLDTTPKQKPIGTPLNAGLKRKPTSHEKLAMARDVSLDYKINKPQSKSNKEEDDDGFREMYKERLLGPSMLVNQSTHSVDFVESLAGNKINATINQTTGTFDGAEMRKVRGKPLDRDHLRNCTDSNYFMNQILKKQEVKPVWIENQLSLDGNIRAFKQGVEDMWFRWMIYDSEIAHVVQSATVLGTIEHEFERKVTSLAAKDKDELAALLNESDLKYVETKVGLLNSEIRNYNLQCPSVTGHKFKLQADREIREGYWRMLENFPSSIQVWFDKNKTKKKSTRVIMEYKDKSGGGFLGLWGGDSGRGTPHEIHVNRNVDTKLHVWKAIKDVFTLSK